MTWFVVSACSAAADVREFPVVRALLCFLTRCMNMSLTGTMPQSLTIIPIPPNAACWSHGI